MIRGSFPGLGFDPTTGELSSVASVLDSLQNACQLIEEVTPRLLDATEITDDADWGGSAAEEFSDHGDDLPRGLNTGMVAMSAVGEAMAQWFGQMKANQDKAEELETTAKRLRKQLAKAEDAVRSTGDKVPANIDHPRYAELRGAFDDAVRQRLDIATELDDTIAKAHRLESKHEREADATAEAVRGAQDGDPFKPENDGFGVQLLDGISAVSGEVAKWSASAATVAAFVPGGQPFAAGLTGVSGAATLVNVTSSIGQHAVGSSNAPSWSQIALAATPAKAGGSLIKGARGGYKAANGQGTREVASSVTQRGLDGARKGFTRNNAYTQSRKGFSDVRAARNGETLRYTPQSTGLEAAATIARTPTDAAESANNLADRDHKSGNAPHLGSAGKGAAFLLNPSADRLVDFGKGELSQEVPGEGRALSGQPSNPDDDWRRRP